MDSIEAEIGRCADLSDEYLWHKLPNLARGEQEELARFLVHLGEIARRDLHLKHAYSGLFTYLIALGFSEWEARARAVAAGAARKYPSILTMLASGRLHLYAVVLVTPYLTSENHESLLGKACRRTTRELQALIASLDPEAGRRDVVRVISVPTLARGPAGAGWSDGGGYQSQTPDAGPGCEADAGGEAQASAGSSAEGSDDLFSWAQTQPSPTEAGHAEPCGPSGSARLRLSFDCSQELHDLFLKAQGLLRHKYPFGEMELVFGDALWALLDRIDPGRRIQRRSARAQRRAGGWRVSMPGEKKEGRTPERPPFFTSLGWMN